MLPTWLACANPQVALDDSSDATRTGLVDQTLLRETWRPQEPCWLLQQMRRPLCMLHF